MTSGNEGSRAPAWILLLLGALMACASLGLFAFLFLGFLMGTSQSPGALRGLAMILLAAQPVLWCVGLYGVLSAVRPEAATRAAAWPLLPLPLACALLAAWKPF